VIELTYQIGLENMRARVNATLGLTEQGFNSGDACRIPWASDDRKRGVAGRSGSSPSAPENQTSETTVQR
jgi:hypothetical protein